MELFRLAFVLCYLVTLEFILTSTERISKNETTTPEKIKAFPYVLQKKTSDLSMEKQYTLLTSATASTVPNTHFYVNDFYGNKKENYKTADKKIKSSEIDVTENVLPKYDSPDDWQYISNFGHLYDTRRYGLGYNIMIDILKHYYSNTGNAPSNFYGINFPAVPLTILLLINLSILTYILLGVLGLIINKLSNAGFNGHGPYRVKTPDFGYDFLGHRQYGFLRKVSKDI